MKIYSNWMTATAGAAMLALMSSAAGAAPVGATADMAAATQHASALERVASRHCWTRDGERYCRRGVRAYGFYYGRPRAEAYPAGSLGWWRAMDYEGRGGHGRTR